MPKDILGPDLTYIQQRFDTVRSRTEALASGFSAEDLCVQTMADVSPGKWHLAHVTWFWETFLLKHVDPGYEPFDARFNYLFNSYYNAIGARHARPERGFLTRPSLEEVLAYRAYVSDAVRRWLETAETFDIQAQLTVLQTGFAHEEQHQELFLTDIKHVLSCNSFPETGFNHDADEALDFAAENPDPEWVSFKGGLYDFGYEGLEFAFDNEGPIHKAYLKDFALARRPVSQGEYLAFIEDGGYQTSRYWLSDGWAVIQAEQRTAPLYWRRSEEGWRIFTLHGETIPDSTAPVCHLDYYEASAFAVWAGARLPEEYEWERAAKTHALSSEVRWADPCSRLHPVARPGGADLVSMFGEVWEWTRSAYSAYPGFSAPEGAIGEYNGKFMCGQFVLRGGSCLTPPDHIRETYRNFLPPGARWQMSGLRLARDL